jgi:hypothetical protein
VVRFKFGGKNTLKEKTSRVRSRDGLCLELRRAKLEAIKRNPALHDFSELSRLSSVHPATLREWFVYAGGSKEKKGRGIEPRALKLAQVADVLGISMDQLVYSEAKGAFSSLGIDQMVSRLDDSERDELAMLLRTVIEVSDGKASVIAALRKHVEICAETRRQIEKR